VALRTTDGTTVLTAGRGPAVTVTGAPEELLLFSAGRLARVEFDGDDAAVQAVRDAPRACSPMPRVAILDDYAGLALGLADWSPVQIRSEVTVFDRHLSEAEAADALRPFDVICTVRERMRFRARSSSDCRI